ncbi:hypothetical protein JZK55_01680 [Dissulfurispira thermophila]|uniref:Uncharacterized protein n=1 Tax=Dissulfurispira thermophila TaxID=2715679 RepID=A0A7G1GZB2_9BACT|nr:HD-GYP domain-containing protein [Dissulfurispira thermophila]BCB95246.1 hypothetical protein JZK55_01680 [Dissulfurispira thermophila]
MPNITDYIIDTSYIKQVIENLKNIYNINGYIIDSEGNVVKDIVLMPDDLPTDNLFKGFYQFEFIEDIGWLMCASPDEIAISNADWFIKSSITAINLLLQRKLKIQQMSKEIIELSEQINFLFNLAKKVTGVKKLHEFCEISLTDIAKKIEADSGFIIVKDSQNNEDIVIPYNLSADEVINIKNQEMFNLALKKKEAILSKLDNGISAIVSPINIKDGIIGFMAFFRKQDKRFFTAYEKKLVSIIDNSITATIETLRLYDSLKELYLNTVKALAAAIDAKDPYTHGHSFRVAKYSMAIAKKMGFEKDTIADIEIAGYMHDIGKIDILDPILNKSGKLTDKEYEEIQKYPHITYKILEPIKLPDNIVLPASQHHEKINGTGYPYGLTAEEMHEFAKIIAVADVFDALTSDRIYRPAMTIEKALTIIVDGINKEFDGKVVAALIEVIRDVDSINELENIRRDLKFSDIQILNKFLEAITEKLMLPNL